MEQAKLSRVPDWRARLQAYINAAMDRGFRPGRFDCALFAAGAVEAMTGVDLARGHRGYRTLNEGRRKLRERGFEDAVALAAAVLSEKPVSLAQAGDLAVVEDREGEAALGVVQGARIYVLHPAGIGLLPLRAAFRAFRV